ncbi:MAG: sensor histidine kinase [Mucilaginibacter sp.]|nr:sensor histidine kinase [Mucilaginibacter sp.]
MKLNILKYALCFMLGLTVISKANAQTPEIDKLLKQAATAKTDTQKARIYNSLALKLGESDTLKAFNYQLQAYRIFQKYDDKVGLAQSYHAKGYIFICQDKSDSALYYLTRAIALVKQSDHKDLQGKILVDLGIAEREQNNYPKVLIYLKQAIVLSEQTGNKRNMADAYVQLGSALDVMKNFKAAKIACINAYHLFKELKDTVRMSRTLGSIGFTERSANHPDSAIYYLNKAMKLFKIEHDFLMVAIAHTEIGKTLVSSGSYTQAIPQFLAALDAYRFTQNTSHFDALNISLGICYNNTGEYTKAGIFLNKGYLIAKQQKDMEMQLEALSGLKDYYKNIKDFKQGFKFQDEYTRVKDSLDNKQQLKTIADMSAKYESEKKEREILLLGKENTIQKLSISRKNLAIGVIIFVFIVAFGVGGLFYNRYKLKQGSVLQGEIIKQQDLATKAIIEAEENERRRIAGELHDGLGQMFSTVKLNLSGIESDITFTDEPTRNTFAKSLLLIDESCKEVRSISHQMAPNVLLKSGLVSAVRDFITQVDERQLKISLDVQGLSERLESNTEAVLYRVIQEAVNNVIKHAKATHLDIQLVKDVDGLSVMIEDDGVGFDPALLNDGGGMGLKNIITRITYLKGTVDFDPSPGNGTVISVWVPAAG